MKIKNNRLLELKKYENELYKKRKKLVNVKEKEIEKIDKIYQKKMNQRRYNGQIRVEDLANRNVIQANNVIKEQEEQLNVIRKKYNNQTLKEIEKRNINKEFNSAEMQRVNIDHNDKMNILIDKANQEIISTSNRINEQNLLVKQGLELKNSLVKNKYKNSSSELKSNYQEEISQIKNFYENYKRGVEVSNIKEVSQEKKRHFQKLINIKRKSDKKIEIQSKAKEELIRNKNKYYTRILNDQKKSFHQKINQAKDEQEVALKNLKNNFKEELNNIQKENQQIISLSNKKTDDNFYLSNKLNYTVSDYDDGYKIDVVIPEYEKDKVMLTGNKRHLNIFKARSIDATSEYKDGTASSTHRAESLKVSFNVKEIIDIKSVTKTYKDGLLSFLIKKA